MVKLSVIIPYYKTKELTCKLLKSLKPQITRETEIIVIDDGCNEKELDAFNIRVIHLEKNSGVSKARNVGIDNAKGKYIAFIDSDDMIMPNYIETLLKLIETQKEDIIYFNWLDINTNEVVTHPENPAVWKGIYKKEILPRFDEKLKAKEDYFFNEKLEKENHTKYYYNKVLYIYNSGRLDGLTCKNQRGEL